MRDGASDIRPRGAHSHLKCYSILTQLKKEKGRRLRRPFVTRLLLRQVKTSADRRNC